MSSEPTRALLRDYPPEELAELLHRAVNLGLDFASGRARDDQVLRYASVTDLIQRFAAPLPEDGLSEDELLDALQEVASWSIAQSDPRYLAFPDTGDSVAGIAAEITAAFLNQNLIAFDRSAPAGTVIEAQLIAWLRELVGYETTPLSEYAGLQTLGGMWTSGGNMSNHVAMAVALATNYPEIRSSGLVGLRERPAVLLARGVEHFSYLGAAQVLGLGSQGLIWANPTPDYTSDVAVIQQLLANPPENTRIFMVVGVAGNCRTTGLDDLTALADACERHGAWFHVDACHGGSLLFSDKLRDLVAGIERADSVSLDPHKGLFVTYPSSYVLFRDPSTLARFARYPDRVNDPGCLDLGLITPFYGSRGFESLKLWAFIRHQGRRGIARLVEARHATFQQMVALLERTGYFRVIGSSNFYRCAFVFCPEPVAAEIVRLRDEAGLHSELRELISRFTAAYCERLYRSGKVAFDLFALQDLGNTLGLGTEHRYQVMGMCVGHPWIDEGTQAEIEKSIHKTADEFVEAMMTALEDLEAHASSPRADRSDVSGPAGW